MRRILIICLILFMSGSLAATLQASPSKRLDPLTNTCRILNFYTAGWKSPGAKIWKASCKSCHRRGNTVGAPFLHTESKTPKGWTRVFVKRYPKCARTGKWDDLSLEQIVALNDFLYMNAAGTYDPNDAEDCG